MKSRYDYELIRDYLHGLTDQKTSREISELIRTDEIARDIAAGILRLEKAFKGNDEDVERYLDKFLEKQLTTINAKSASPVRVLPLWLKVAASLVVFGAIGYFAIAWMKGPSAEMLVVAELSEPYPVSSLFRGQGEATPEEKGYAAYSEGKYEEAAKHFSEVQADSPNAGTSTFYHAMSYLYTHDYARAVDLLDSPSIAKSRFVQQARWFKALALMAMGDRRQGTELLRAIKEEPTHFKSEEAAQILASME